MKAFAFLLSFLIALATGEAQTTAQPPLPTRELKVGSISVTAEVADDDAERATGLMFRESLAGDSGMLFVMPRVDRAGFWMKNTRIPLSIAFLDPRGMILEIHEMKAGSEKMVRSTFPNVAYALEMPSGWFSKKSILPGEKVAGLPPPAAE